MTYGMEDQERRDTIEFPKGGDKAVNIPPEKIQFRAGDGQAVAKRDSTTLEDAELSREIDTDFQKLRSMVIFSSVPFSIKDLYGSITHYSEGLHLFQEMPEVEKFEIDYGAEYTAAEIEPDKVVTSVKAFNTPRIPIPSDSINFTATLETEEKTIDSTSWTDVVKLPTSSFEKENINFQNTGSNALEYRFRTVNAGIEQTEALDTQGTEVETVSSGKSDYVFNQKPAEMVVLQAREETGGNSTTIKAQFTGE